MSNIGIQASVSPDSINALSTAVNAVLYMSNLSDQVKLKALDVLERGTSLNDITIRDCVVRMTPEKEDQP